MTLSAAILLALTQLPPAWGEDETSSERSARYETIAHAIESATLTGTCAGDWSPESTGCRRYWPGTRRDGARLLVAVGYGESAFKRNVGAGACARWECDPVRLGPGVVRHQARTYWQLHQNPTFVPEHLWDAAVGVEYVPTTTAAFLALRLLGSGFRSCKSIPGAIGFYAGNGCRPAPRTPERVALYERLRQWI